MWDFLIVLGIIPGTNIQITFSELCVSSALVLSLYLIHKEHLTPKRALYLISIYWHSRKGQQLKLPV